MSKADQGLPTRAQLLKENEHLRARLDKAKQTIQTIRNREVKSPARPAQRPHKQPAHEEQKDGTPGSIGTFERMQAEEAVQVSETRYRRLFETAQDGILILDADTGRITDVNPFLMKMSGYSQEEFLGKRLWEIGPFRDMAASRTAFKKLQQQEYIRFENLPLETSAGQRMEVEFVSNVYQVDHKKVVQCNIRDITERTRAEAETQRLLTAVREEKERLSALLNNISDEVWFADTQKKFTLANPAALQAFGIHPGVAMDVEAFAASLEVYRPDGSPRPIDEAPPLRALGGETVRNLEETVRIPSTGVLRHREVNATPVRGPGGQIIGSVSVVRDITERMHAEEALRQSEERFRLALKNAPVSVAAQDRDLRFQWAFNQRTVPADQIIGKTDYDLFAPADAEHLVALKRMVLETGREVRENLWITSNGKRVYLDLLLEPLRDMAGNVTGVGIATIDLTAIKKAEEELQKSETRYRSLVELSPDAIFVNRDNRIVIVNQAMLELFGATTPEQILGKTPFDLFHPDYHAQIRERIQKMIAGGTVPMAEEKIVRLDGSLRTVEVAPANITDLEGPATQVILHDITERLEREKELEHLNRTLRALSNINQAMMRSTDETSFMQEVCRIVVEDCGHAMTWIGFAEQDEGKSVRPVASAGFEEGYLDTLKITWADAARGRGPTGTAIRTGQVSLCRNMLTDPKFKPWREQALKRGYASSIVLPLMSEGTAFGAINIYSREPDPFAENEVELLRELAGDLAYGITMLRTRLAHAEAQEALRQSEERYHSLFNGMTEGFALHEIICDGQGKPCDYRFLDVNPAFERLTGLKRKDVIGRTHNEVLPNDSPLWIQEYGAVVTTGQPVHFENYSPVLQRYYEVLAYRPAPGRFAVIFMDITDRKRMEVELKNSQTEIERRANELDTVFNSITDGIIVYNADGSIQRTNPAAVEMLGFDPIDETIPDMAKLLATRTMDGALLDPALAPSARALRGETVVGEHYVIQNPRGEDMIVLSSASPLWGGDRVTGAVVVWQDVTEQHKAEETQARLASFPQLNPNPIVELDQSETILFVNPVARQMFPELEAMGVSHPWLNELESTLVDFHEGKVQTVTREVQVGERYYLQTVQYVAPSERIRIYGIDITARKEAEEALRQARDELEVRVEERTRELSMANQQLHLERRRFNDVLELLPAYLILLTPDYKATFANRTFRERFGEAHGRPCYEFLFGRSQPCEICETYKVLKTGQPLKWEWTGPDNHTYDVHDFPFTDVDGSTLIMEMGIDITERKLAETQLRLQTSAMEAAANGIIITDRDGTIQWANPAFSQVTGYSHEEVVGQNPRLLKSGKQGQLFYEKMWQTLLAGEVWRGEIVNRRKSGELYVEEEIITPVRDEQNQISHFIAVKQDISSRKQAEEALRLANAYNRNLIEASLDPQVTITPEGKIGDVNSATEKVTGRSRQELIGTDFHSYFSDPAKARLGYQTVFERGSVLDYELEIRHKDGHITPVLYNASVYRGEAGKVQGVFAVARDITDRKQFEAQLMQAEKHAVIGRMVGSVTHEINNPLQTIKNCLYLIRQDTAGNSSIVEPLDMASSETARLTDLVGQLRELYRPRTDLQIHPHELLDILEEVHALLTPHLNNSKVRWNPLTGMTRCYINCVRDQILEVFLNISMNAIEAMKSTGGKLSVDMAFKDEQVGVVFRDSGPGVSEEILQHIFEPFMTTKTSGLGLGLSISYGIVQRHGGQIAVENCPEGGAAFTVWLPIARKNKKEKTIHATKR